MNVLARSQFRALKSCTVAQLLKVRPVQLRCRISSTAKHAWIVESSQSQASGEKACWIIGTILCQQIIVRKGNGGHLCRLLHSILRHQNGRLCLIRGDEVHSRRTSQKRHRKIQSYDEGVHFRGFECCNLSLSVLKHSISNEGLEVFRHQSSKVPTVDAAPQLVHHCIQILKHRFCCQFDEGQVLTLSPWCIIELAKWFIECKNPIRCSQRSSTTNLNCRSPDDIKIL